MAPPAPTFQTSSTRALRAAGLAGERVYATVHAGALELRGDAGGAVRITTGDVARLRVGYLDAKRRTYEVRVWRVGAAEPLTIAAERETWAAYRQVVLGFVASLAAEGRLDRVEGGRSKLDALLAPVLVGCVALGAIAIALFVLDNEPWWGRMLVPAVPVALTALLLWLGLTRHWPRQLRELADLDRQLPPAPTAR